MKAVKSIGLLYADLGWALLLGKRYEEAADALRKALSEDAQDVPRAHVHLGLGKTYAALHRNSEALEAFLEAVRIDPESFDSAKEEIEKLRADMAPGGTADAKSGWDWVKTALARWTAKTQPFRDMGFKLLESSKFAEAESMLKISAFFSSEEPGVQEALGWAQLRQGKAAGSVAAFEAALRLEDTRISAYRGLAEAKSNLGRFGEAAEILTRGLKKAPGDVTLLLARGIATRNMGNLDESERMLRACISRDTGNVIAHRELAATLQAAGRTSDAAGMLAQAAALLTAAEQYSEAEGVAAAAIKLDPANAAALLELGRAGSAQGKWDEAVGLLQKITEVTPRVKLEVARAELGRRNYREAAAVLDDVLSSDPQSAEALGLRAAAARGLGNPQEALKFVEAALARNQKNGWMHAERGCIMQILERRPEAISSYRSAIDLQPENRWVHEQLGLLLSRTNDYAGALPVLTRARSLPYRRVPVEIDPDIVRPSDSLLAERTGEALYYVGKYEEASVQFAEALALDPSNGDASFYRGASLRMLGRYEEAISALQLAIDLDSAQERPPRAAAYGEMGEALRILNRFLEAKPALEKALKIGGEDEKTLARYGEVVRVLGESDKAVDALQRAVKLDPEDGWALGSLGAALANLARYASALAALEKAVKLDAANPFNWGYLGMVLRQGCRYAKALEAIDQALKLDPKAAWILIEKGITLRDMEGGGCDQSLPFLQKATDLDPSSAFNWCQSAICLNRLGRNEDALRALEKGLGLDASLTWAWALKSVVLEAMGRKDDASQAEQRSLDEPVSPESFLSRGDVYYELACYERAARDLRKAIELDPGYAAAYNSLAWMEVTRPGGSAGEAVEFAAKAVDLSRGSDGQILDTLGWSYFKLGRLDEAYTTLQRACLLTPEDLRIADHVEVCRSQIEQRGNTASATATATPAS